MRKPPRPALAGFRFPNWSSSRTLVSRPLAALPLPLAGLLSDRPAPEVVAQHEAIERAARDLGCTAPAPFELLSFMPLSVIPAVRVTDQGIVEL